MTDIEKVAKGIDICLLRFRCGIDCPYYDDGCQEKLREDALELLKEQRKEIDCLTEKVKKFELEKSWDESPDRMNGCGW